MAGTGTDVVSTVKEVGQPGISGDLDLQSCFERGSQSWRVVSTKYLFGVLKDDTSHGTDSMDHTTGPSSPPPPNAGPDA